MIVCKIAFVGFLTAVIALPMKQPVWHLIQNTEGTFHLVNIEPDQLSKESVRSDPDPLFDPENDMSFHLFTRNNPSSAQFLVIGNPASIAGSNFNPAHPTRFTIHGWGSSANDGMNSAIRDRLLAMGEYNVIYVDWSIGAASPDYAVARQQVGPAGFGLGRLIDQLIEHANANPNDMNVIGFSFGAHVAGNAGKHLNGQLNSIIALDPAGPLFHPGQEDSVSPQDGVYVETIMTNAGQVGIDWPVGQANFYPNGGRTQPGCGPDTGGGCAHVRAPTYFIESIGTSVPFRATRCASYDEILEGLCTPSGADANMGGEPSNQGRGVDGIYFLTTNAASPFAQG
ncbi:pancreatic lipase-related protein 2-like [Topomyia yanbarensis]|uniref:pancreatic lipase-related protein 2-like n=1 Tax=Topomyia yanbarensis TaxID=2498891 RepID=UPI00273B04E6|nr:pancreatic lipase-related protein 2-like [Topomyia yanbarensis]